MNITQDEELTLLDSKNDTEWNNACDAIKKARNGQYPPDWYEVVIAGGLMGCVTTSWKNVLNKQEII